MSLPTANAWLYSWVDTDVVGYRQITIDAGPFETLLTVPAGYYRWPDYIDAIDNELSSEDPGYSCSGLADGRVEVVGSSIIEWPDRLGWLLGFESEPGTNEGADSTVTSRAVAPGAIPLLSANWSAIDRKTENKIMVDRHLRGHGYAYGSADVWRWSVVMHVSALAALRAGWCLSGKVTVATEAPADFGSATAWSKTNPGGYVDGMILGVEGGEFIDATRTAWACRLLIATVKS